MQSGSNIDISVSRWRAQSLPAVRAALTWLILLILPATTPSSTADYAARDCQLSGFCAQSTAVLPPAALLPRAFAKHDTSAGDDDKLIRAIPAADLLGCGKPRPKFAQVDQHTRRADVPRIRGPPVPV